MSQHKATLRKSLRSALKHKNLADKIIDDIYAVQTKFNAAMDKIDADDSSALDIDYASTIAVSISEYDAAGVGQHKADMRKTLRSALSHKKLADEIVDSIEELQATLSALMVKLDADAGTLSGTNVATFGLSEMGADSVGSDAQHKASFRKSLRSALSHKRLADQIIDAIEGIQGAINSALAQLDIDGPGATGALVGLYTPFKVTAIDPDSE
ncbi:MAG: hypothetical protein HWN81_00030 [Candidatus Lokiarchaeota archaeon]|nr:hypothetical protein [Candidatus Lokiarchaeota archaeon]